MRSARASVVSLEEARTRTAERGQGQLAQPSEPNSTGVSNSATEAAFESGYKDGVATAKAQYAESQQQLGYLIQVLENPVNGLGDDVARELVALSVEIARSVLAQAMRHEPEQITELVSNALTQLPRADKPVAVTAHTDDLSLLKAHAPEHLSGYQIQWVEDSAIDRGSFTVSQDNSDIHGGINAMLQTVLQQLDIDVDPQ
jgi:flagellar assembly protein FliH